MAKILDITDSLHFEEKPIIRVRGETLTVNDEAVVILEAISLFDDDATPADLIKGCKMLFDDEEYEKIKALKLNLDDFKTFLQSAIRLVTGGAENEGEAATRATI